MIRLIEENRLNDYVVWCDGLFLSSLKLSGAALNKKSVVVS